MLINVKQNQTGNQQWAIKNRQSRMGNQEWEIKNGQSRMGNQDWAIKNGQSKMGNQESAIKNGQSRMGNQEWEIKNRQSRMGNPETLATLGTQDTGHKTKTNKHKDTTQHRKLKRSAKRTPLTPGVTIHRLIDFWCLTPLSAIFQLCHSDQF